MKSLHQAQLNDKMFYYRYNYYMLNLVIEIIGFHLNLCLLKKKKVFPLDGYSLPHLLSSLPCARLAHNNRTALKHTASYSMCTDS